MFVDRAVVTFIAGKGGDGICSFRREKFVPRGGPDGGDGGKGGDVILHSNFSKQSLIDFKYKKMLCAGNGAAGSSNNKTGHNGVNLLLEIPAGTVIKSFPDEKLIFDFDRSDKELVLARGGRPGRGNSRYKSSINQAPRRADKGEKGEEITVILELKLIAYAGLVGLPNAGKSTLISKISSAKPKIADYPFTTLFPNLGVAYHADRSLVVADIPGIIEGAHRGEGMGLQFLKHIERTKTLVFLIDGSPFAADTPKRTYEILAQELRLYHPMLLKKKQLVAINKIDLLEARGRRFVWIESYCRKQGIPYIEISAVKETHIEEFKRMLFALANDV